ncbi:MAG: ParB/RepB/Spo0J family partition protein [Fibrobacter sp.]|nr:ParB/RepB/Spo0J family partition protein [Fibrobacter sp.]
MGKKSFALGRGLSDILKDHDANKNFSANAPQGESSNGQQVVEIQLDLIDPNPFQPRKFFSDDELSELAETIKTHGLLTPINVRSVNGRYQIISGERRTRASRLAGLKTIKAQVFSDIGDKAMAEWALIENIQRVDLNPIETAQSYQQLIDNHNYTHEDLAKAVGKSRSAITNALRLLKLPDQVQYWIQEGKLSSGAARALCSDKIADVETLAKRIIDEGLNVRQIEAISRGEEIDPTKDEKQETGEKEKSAASPAASANPPKPKPELSADMKQFESKLETYFGTKVAINPSAGSEAKGTIVINYYSMDDLNRIQQLMENA